MTQSYTESGVPELLEAITKKGARVTPISRELPKENAIEFPFSGDLTTVLSI